MQLRRVSQDDKTPWQDLWLNFVASQGESLPSDVTNSTFDRSVKGEVFTASLVVREADPAEPCALVNYRVDECGETQTRGRRCYLEDLFVADSARRQGVGVETFKLVGKEVSEKRCFQIYWDVYETNLPAIQLYRKVGSQTLQRQFRVRLDNSDSIVATSDSAAAAAAGESFQLLQTCTGQCDPHLSQLWQASRPGRTHSTFLEFWQLCSSKKQTDGGSLIDIVTFASTDSTVIAGYAVIVRHANTWSTMQSGYIDEWYATDELSIPDAVLDLKLFAEKLKLGRLYWHQPETVNENESNAEVGIGCGLKIDLDDKHKQLGALVFEMPYIQFQISLQECS